MGSATWVVQAQPGFLVIKQKIILPNESSKNKDGLVGVSGNLQESDTTYHKKEAKRLKKE